MSETFWQELNEYLGFNPSEQQQTAFDWVETGSGSAQLEAVAGSGKTTTLIHALMRTRGNVFFGAFNKSIATEIKNKVAAMVDKLTASENDQYIRIARHLGRIRISTIHGAGFAACNRRWEGVKVEEQKVRNIFDELRNDPEAPLYLPDIEAYVLRMVSYGKQFLMGVKRDVNNMVVWEKLSDHFSADESLPDEVSVPDALEWVVRVYQLSHAQCPTVIDHDDMLYAPIAYNMRMFRNDWFFMDEDQDANVARRELAKMMLQPRSGRFFGVGDKHQAIYAFTGASSESIDRIVEEFNCKRLKLTVTYRCPRSVVDYVHRWVRHIEAHSSAPEGAVTTLALDPASKDPWYVQRRPDDTDAVLCRYTKPLIETAYGMLKHGISCKVEGRDIGKGLISLATRWKVRTLDTLDAKLERFLVREVAKARAKRNEKREQDARDKVDALRVIIDRCQGLGQHDVACVVDQIRSIFDDNVSGVITLATGHKSKGREWPAVFWLTTMDRQGNKQWEHEAELNIKYVIGTRAMKELVLVPEIIRGGK